MRRYFRTPRTTIKEFVHLLSILEQNPQVSWQELIGTIPVEPDRNPEMAPPPDIDDEPSATAPPGPASTDPADELASFTLK